MQTLSSLSPRFMELLAKRNLTDPKAIEHFLSASLEHLEDPFAMKGMREAVALIHKTISEGKSIIIHGDYDVDGVTAAALMARTLGILEARSSVFLPDRVRDGYGVCERAIVEAAQNGAALLITADCGITAFKQIEKVRSLGMDVIVIDHHRIPSEGLPPASVILNPQQADCAYPCKELSAAGLVLKLSQALIGDQAFKFLDLAALSTVCDVAPLAGENRIIVKHGLQKLSSRANPGVRAMLEAGSVKAKELNSGHVGFMIGPRLNAAGRMSSPDIALRLLLTDHAREAESLAWVLEEENRVRQQEERQVVKEAIQEVERVVNFNRDRVIVVGREGWHQGVIGIVASRLVERYHRPAVVIAFDKGIGKGSGRSIKGFNLFLALETCKDLFAEFGGHEQAAGLSMKMENLAAFRAKVNDYARETVPAEVFVRKVPVDMELGFGDLKNFFIEELKLMEPHGSGNPRPVFLTSGLEVKTRPEKIFGETYKFYVTDGAATHEALWNDKAGNGANAIQKGAKLTLVYSLKEKFWDGIQSLTLEVKDIIPQF